MFRTEKYFYYHRVSNDRSVLSQSLTIFCSVAGISHSREVLPYKRLMGMRRWMGSHCHVWIDYNRVAFSMESLEWRRTFSDFWSKKKFFTFTVSKRIRMFVLQVKSEVFFIHYKVLQIHKQKVKVMLHGTIRNDDFQCNTAQQYWNNVATIQNNIATML